MTRPATYPDLAGRVAVVTGGSRGIGAAISTALAAQDARVIVTGRDKAALHAVTAQIRKLGGHAHPVVAELTDPDQVERLRTEAEQTYGPVQLLAVVAGGSGNPAPITELSLNDWHHTIDANLTTAFLTLRTFLPAMIDRRRGSVVTMSSTAGRLPTPASPAYGAANAGLLMLTRQAAMQVAPHNVRVNTIAPGAVLTDRLRQMPAHVRDGVASQHPLGRLGDPQDIAAAALFLLSDASSWITAVTLDASGGRVAL
jgi:3-oxoacyl-[acyl-carrier protein] reductase